MGKTIAGYSDWGDAATLTATNEDASFPVENLQKAQVVGGDRFRTNNLAGGVSIDLDRGSSQAANTIAALYTNLTSAATWQIRFASSQANLSSSPSYDSGSITAWASTGLEDLRNAGIFVHSLHYIDGGHSDQWCRVTITDGANPDGYMSIGRLVVGNFWVSTRGRAYGDSLPGMRTYAQLTKLNGATLSTRIAGRQRQRFELVSTTEAEAYTTYLHLSRIRDGRDVLVAHDVDEAALRHSKMLYGFLGDVREPQESSVGLFRMPFQVEEI